ncbi:hypothetical protein KZ326_08175 [Glaesserella parasuis]|nr:hypothetical protein [Glaesserella parasuis]
MKIEFPATTGENPIVEGDKVTINYTPELENGTAGTPTTLTYTYTGGNWVQDEKDSLKLTPTTDQSGKVSVTILKDKVADNTEVKAQTTDVSGKTSAESDTTKVVAPFDEKSAQPTITVKAVDVVSNGEAANNEPEKAIVTVDTTKNGQKAPKGSLVKVYKAGELNTPIGEGVIDENGKAVITITENTNGAPQDIKSTDSLVATVQEVGTDGTTPVKSPSIPSTAVQVGTPAVGKHSNNDVENSGGHEGDETEPKTAPTLTAISTDDGLGSVKVGLPADAVEGDRVEVTFVPEGKSKGEEVTVTLTKKNGQWESNNPELIPTPANGSNEATIPKDKVANNTDVTAVIKDLADNGKEASPVKAYPDERTPLNNVTLEKSIDTDTVSNATPEKFTIKGTAEKGAVVKAYVMHNDEKVEIGSTTVASENGEFTFDTNNIRDGQLKEKLKDFNFSTNSPATAITLEATSTGKAPSAPQTVNATAARKGEKDDHTETTAPENPTITSYVEGFGGAKVVLPTPAQGEALEVEITLTPKGENGASEQAKKVKLAHNGSQWVVEGDNANLITLKQVDGKTVAIVTGDKAPFGGTLSATTTDFAGNKPEQAATQELNKGPTDQTAKDTHSPERTDVPTITAGRTEAVSGVDNDQPNAGDIVAKPGGDNDRMVVKYVDENGQAKEISVKKDLEQGKWVLDTTQPAEQDKKPAEGDYIIKDDGTVIVKGQKVKDGSEAEAIGYKTVGNQQKASSEPYVDNKDSSGNTLEENQIPTDENGQKRTRTDLAKIITHKDDDTPTQTDAPTVTKGQSGTLEQGSAKIKPGPDNTEVVVKFQGYAKTVTETTPTTSATGADGQAGATQQTTTKVITSTPVTDATTGDAAQTQTPQNENAVLIAKKENGEWKLYTTTEQDYNTKVIGTDGKEHNAPKNLMPAPEDVATIDKTSGEITLKPQAVQDNTKVSATGFNAMKQPAEGKQDSNNVSVDGDLTAKQIEDKTVFSPEITQTNKGDVMVKPGQDNKEMTVTYTDKNGQTQTIKLEKVPASQGETGTAAYPQDATKWVVKKEGTTITGTDGTTTGDTVGTTTENGETISLPNGVTVDTTTGAVTIPKDATQIGKTVKADAKDDQNNTITTGDYTVQEDMTPDHADPITTGNDGDKATFTPGDDTKEMEFFKKPTNGTTSEDKPNGESIGKVVKKENGQWEWQGNGTNTGDAPQVDPATGKVTFPSGGGSLVGDGNGIVAVATDGKNNKSTPTEPVVPPKKDSSEHAAETPTVKPITEGEQQGGMEVTPGGDNNTLTVRYEKEVKPEEGATGTSDGTSGTEGEKNYETITAVKDPNTNKWSFSGDVPSEIAEIDEDTGKITLKPEAVKDGTGIKVEATDSSGNTIVKENDESTKAPSNLDVVDPNNQPKPPTVEPEPETPAQSQPELIDDTTTITPADETPTTFKNTGIGQVQINPGAGVDFISFTVTTQDGGEQNIAFIKDGNGWEKYVMQLGDGNGNDIVDGDEKVIYDNVQTIGNGPLTVSGITSDSITNILVGKAGDEFLQPFARPANNSDDWAVRGEVTGDKVHSFKVKQDPKVAVPERMDVLSDGDKLVAPIIQPEIVDGKYQIKVTADPTQIYSMGFDIATSEEYSTFYILKNGDGWTPLPGTHGYNFGKYFYADPNDSKVFYIRDVSESDKLGINRDVNGYARGDAQAHNLIDDIVYGVKNEVNDYDMDKWYAVGEKAWDSNNKIRLTDITITDAAREGSSSTTPPSTGGDSSTNSGTQTGGGSQPQQPPAPPKPVIGEPTAEKDSSKTGGVKVKPGENTDAFRVDYQRPDGTNRTIWFKKNNQTWELDNTKNNQANDVQVSTNGSSGLISLNTSNGEVTFAPHAVKDKTTVTITALEGDIARKQKGIEADAEPQPTKPTAQIDSANRGGAIVKVGENTSKFKVTYTDEKTGKQKTLVYAKESNNWALKEVDGQQSSQAPEGVNLTNEGKVTLAPNTVKDNSTVKIESYNMEGFIKGNASVKTTLDVVNYDGVTTGVQNITGRLGYNSWTGIFGIKGNDDVYQDWGNSPSSGLKQLSEGGYGNSRPQSTRQDGNGATYKWSNSNDTVLIHDTLGKQNDQSGKNYLLTLDFQQGNDTLVVGNDLGTKYKRDGKDIIRLNMGEGDDLLMVGTDNEYFEEYRNKETGEIDIFTKDAKNSSQWRSQNMDQTWERLSDQINHRNQAGGGRIENATINMGRGDDTIIVEGITGQNFGAIMNSTIDLGDGNNRVVIAPNGAYAYKPGHYFNSPMQARGNINSSTILGGRDSDFIKAALIEQGANIQLKDGNDHVVVNRFQSSTLDMGAGDDLVEIRNYSKDPTTGQTLPGLGTIVWDTQIGAGTRINLGTGNDTFFQGSKHIDYDVQINGGSGIDLYRVGGGSKATTDKIKGFERVELVDNGAIIGMKYSDLKASGLELPMKVMKGTEVKNGDKVKVDLGNNNSDWLAGSPAHNLGDQGGTWTKGSTVKEDGRTYDVYTINNDVKHQVWIEQGITVL